MNCIEELQDLTAVLSRAQALAPQIEHTGRLLIQSLRAGHCIMTAGNGGSASDALHMAEELVGRFKNNRRPLAGISLAADVTALTCIGNDYGFDQIFSRQVEALGKPGDVLVVFSTSGNSPNLLNAVHAAKAKGVLTIAALGKSGGAMAGLADHEVIVPSDTTSRIQEVHTLLLHIWLGMIEEETW